MATFRTPIYAPFTAFPLVKLNSNRASWRGNFSLGFVCNAPSQGTAMIRHYITSGSTFEQDIGYSRAVVAGDWVFVSGTTGFDYSSMSIPEGLLEQTEQCLKNIAFALQQAGSSLADVVRVTYVLPNGAEFPECWPVLRKYFGDIRPAAMMISAGLADPRMRIEIEVTALKQSKA